MSEEEQEKELPPVEVIETIEDLEWLAERLSGIEQLAVDLEADSFYTYYPKVCLVQMSTIDEDFIIDPLAVRDMSPLGPIFRDPKVEKVFHAAEYDLQCLKRDYGFDIANLFDTMAAARILGAKELGLGALVHKYFGVTLSKRLQRSDWGRRPLSDEQIDYARHDTRYLLELRDILHQELEQRDLLRDAHDTFQRLVDIEPLEKVFDPDSFWRLPGARGLSPTGRAILKELYFFREKMAAEMDKAPFRVLPEGLLVRMADVQPKSMEDLQHVHGMSPYLFRRFGRDLLEIIAKGATLEPIDTPPARQHHHKTDFPTQQRFQLLKQWRKAKAIERDVDPVVILATEDLRALAKMPSEEQDSEKWLSVLTDRKRELYSHDLLGILKTEIAVPVPGAGRRRRRRRR